MSNAFDELLDAAEDRKLPPVEKWQPQHEGEIDIRIARDGTWYHEGSEIKRQTLVKLFSSVLRLDGDGHCLVTPEQKLRITVDDAPFIAIDMEAKGEGRAQSLLFTTNVGDVVVADPDHPINVEQIGSEPRPYVEVRRGLKALITRSVFYRLVDLATEEGDSFVVWSRGQAFRLGPSSA